MDFPSAKKEIENSHKGYPDEVINQPVDCERINCFIESVVEILTMSVNIDQEGRTFTNEDIDTLFLNMPTGVINKLNLLIQKDDAEAASSKQL